MVGFFTASHPSAGCRCVRKPSQIPFPKAFSDLNLKAFRKRTGVRSDRRLTAPPSTTDAECNWSTRRSSILQVHTRGIANYGPDNASCYCGWLTSQPRIGCYQYDPPPRIGSNALRLHPAGHNNRRSLSPSFRSGRGVEFWATWCPPCVGRKTHSLVQMQQRLKDKGIVSWPSASISNDGASTLLQETIQPPMEW